MREIDRIVNIYNGLLLIELLEKEICNRNLWMKTWTERIHGAKNRVQEIEHPNMKVG